MLFSENTGCCVSSGGDGISQRATEAIGGNNSAICAGASSSGSPLGKGEKALFDAFAISGSRKASERLSCSGVMLGCRGTGCMVAHELHHFGARRLVGPDMFADPLCPWQRRPLLLAHC